MAAANSASDLDSVETTYLKSIMHSMDAGGFNLMETTLSLPKLLQQSVTAVFWGPGICSIKQNVSKLF